MIKKGSDEMYEMGMNSYNAGRYYEAVQALNKVQPNTTSYEDALTYIGIIFFDQEKYESAVEVWDEMPLGNTFFHQSIQFLKGDALYKLDRYAEAVESFDRIQEDYIFYDKVQFNKGSGLYRLGKYSEAIGAWERIQEDSSFFKDAQCYIGVALFEQGRYEQAMDIFSHVQADYALYQDVQLMYQKCVTQYNLQRTNSEQASSAIDQQQIHDEAELMGDMV